jgi:hypothetical protein
MLDALGILCPCPFCDLGGKRCTATNVLRFVGHITEEGFRLNLSLGHAHNSSFQPAQRSEIHRTAVLAPDTSSSLDKHSHT